MQGRPVPDKAAPLISPGPSALPRPIAARAAPTRRASLVLTAGAMALAATFAPPRSAAPRTWSEVLVEAARLSVQKAPRYDPSYVKLGFPGGDPGWERGACADVVVRAFRRAGWDLQGLLAQDIAANPDRYGIARPDHHIDHRRVRNLVVFFRHHALTLPTEPPRRAAAGGRAVSSWAAGDLVVWDLYGGSSPNHIGILSDRAGPDGMPMVIHHFRQRDGFTGRPSEDDCLDRWKILAHFRMDPAALRSSFAPDAPGVGTPRLDLDIKEGEGPSASGAVE